MSCPVAVVICLGSGDSTIVPAGSASGLDRVWNAANVSQMGARPRDRPGGSSTMMMLGVSEKREMMLSVSEKREMMLNVSEMREMMMERARRQDFGEIEGQGSNLKRP